MNKFIPTPKPTRKPKSNNHSKITQKARAEVYERADGKCERCGMTNPYCFEVAHLVQASQLGRGDDPSNLALLCGPSVNTGTCHWFADYTAEGREWRMNKRKELIESYARRSNQKER